MQEGTKNNMTPKTKSALTIAGFALLSTMAVAGWTRNPNGSNLGLGAVAANSLYANRATYGEAAREPVAAAQDINCAEPAYTNAAYAPGATGYRTSNRPRVIRSTERAQEYIEPRRVERRSRAVLQKQGRSTGKSVAIVGGAAGVGAGIGALSGGGKGAAIGALSGGAAGFVYDRLTHKR